MLEREIWGNTLEDWGISILIILGTIVLMKLISFFSRKVLIHLSPVPIIGWMI